MLRRLIKDSKNLNIVIIYTREPHARQLEFKEIAQPTTWEERRDIAKKTKDELKLDALILIDDIGDPSRKLFGDLPNPAIIVEPDGSIKEKLVWADGDELQKFIKEWKPVLRKTPPPTEPKEPEEPKAGPQGEQRRQGSVKELP